MSRTTLSAFALDFSKVSHADAGRAGGKNAYRPHAIVRTAYLMAPAESGPGRKESTFARLASAWWPAVHWDAKGDSDRWQKRRRRAR